MPSEQVATALRFNDAFNRRDVEEIVRDLDSDVELAEWPDAPGARTFQGPDGVIDAAEPGRDHAPHVRVAGEGLVEQVQTVAIGQLDVHHEGVIGEAIQPRERVGGVRRLGRGEPCGFQRVHDHLAGVALIFHDEHG